MQDPRRAAQAVVLALSLVASRHWPTAHAEHLPRMAGLRRMSAARVAWHRLGATPAGATLLTRDGRPLAGVRASHTVIRLGGCSCGEVESLRILDTVRRRGYGRTSSHSASEGLPMTVKTEQILDQMRADGLITSWAVVPAPEPRVVPLVPLSSTGGADDRWCSADGTIVVAYSAYTRAVERFTVWYVGRRGRVQVGTGGPLAPGPWAALIPQATCISTSGGTAAEAERNREAGTEFDAAPGDRLLLGGVEFEICDDDLGGYPRLVPVHDWSDLPSLDGHLDVV